MPGAGPISPLLPSSCRGLILNRCAAFTIRIAVSANFTTELIHFGIGDGRFLPSCPPSTLFFVRQQRDAKVDFVEIEFFDGALRVYGVGVSRLYALEKLFECTVWAKLVGTDIEELIDAKTPAAAQFPGVFPARAIDNQNQQVVAAVAAAHLPVFFPPCIFFLRKLHEFHCPLSNLCESGFSAQANSCLTFCKWLDSSAVNIKCAQRIRPGDSRSASSLPSYVLVRLIF